MPSRVQARGRWSLRTAARGGLLIEVLVSCLVLAWASQALLQLQLGSAAYQAGAHSRWQAQSLAAEWLERSALLADGFTGAGDLAVGWSAASAELACDQHACLPEALLHWQQAQWQAWARTQLPQGVTALWPGQDPSQAMGVALAWQAPGGDEPSRQWLNPAAMGTQPRLACPPERWCAWVWKAP